MGEPGLRVLAVGERGSHRPRRTTTARRELDLLGLVASRGSPCGRPRRTRSPRPARPDRGRDADRRPPATAAAIGAAIDLGRSAAADGRRLGHPATSGARARRRLAHRVFARVTPADKLRLVEALQAAGGRRRHGRRGQRHAGAASRRRRRRHGPQRHRGGARGVGDRAHGRRLRHDRRRDPRGPAHRRERAQVRRLPPLREPRRGRALRDRRARRPRRADDRRPGPDRQPPHRRAARRRARARPGSADHAARAAAAEALFSRDARGRARPRGPGRRARGDRRLPDRARARTRGGADDGVRDDRARRALLRLLDPLDTCTGLARAAQRGPDASVLASALLARDASTSRRFGSRSAPIRWVQPSGRCDARAASCRGRGGGQGLWVARAGPRKTRRPRSGAPPMPPRR